MQSAVNAVKQLRRAISPGSVPANTKQIVNGRLVQIKATSERSKLNGLGVRDIPIFSHPVYEIPRRHKQKGYIAINRIVAPHALK